MNRIESFIQSYPSRWALGGAAVCGFAALDMAVLALDNFMKSGKAKEPRKQELLDHFSKNLSGSVFYGLCAANIVPGTAFCGAVIYVANKFFSNFTDKTANAMYIAGLYYWFIHYPLTLIEEGILNPLRTRIVYPILEAKWSGVAILIAATAAYKGIPYVWNAAVNRGA